MDAYDPRVTPWQIAPGEFAEQESAEDRLKFLLRYAILAPSTRNTQPWHFALEADQIALYADLAKWQRVADADKRELFISIGCALENLLTAARHFGYDVRIDDEPSEADLAARLFLIPEAFPITDSPDWRFDAVTCRRTEHGAYEPHVVLHEVLEHLEACCAGTEICLYLTGDPYFRRKIDALVTLADGIEFSNPAFRDELAQVIGEGVFGTSWLLSTLGELAAHYLNLGHAVIRHDHEILKGAPIVGVLSSRANGPQAFIQVGQVLERLWLTATAYDVRLHPISQILQVPDTKEQLAGLLPDAHLYPQMVFRLGHAPAKMHHTPRRRLEECLL